MKRLGLIGIWILLLEFTIPLLAYAQVKDFTLPSATSNALIHLSDYSGKVVLINWWRTTCTWSQAEAPKLVELYKKNREQGFQIVGISDDTNDSVAQVPAYLTRYGITWPVGYNDQGEFMREIRPLGQGDTPGNYLVSRSGQISYLGLDRTPEAWAKLVKAVQGALAEKPSTVSPIAQRKSDPAPSFSLSDLHGKKVTLSSFARKPLVVNFFTVISCDWTGAVFAKLYQDYAGRGLEVVGIDLYDSDAAIEQCQSKYHAGYTILRGDQPTQTAWIGSNKGWATFFVTPDGQILKKITDSIDNGIELTVFQKYSQYLLASLKK